MDNISRYVVDLDYPTFRSDRRTRDAVERNLEIIGEAAANLPAEILNGWPEVPWHHMRAFRNLLAHEYFGVDATILWQTILVDLPAVRPALRRMLGLPD